MQAKKDKMKNFSSNLARLLKETGTTKKLFAEEMDVSDAVISNWLRTENGYLPRLKKLPAIAAFFGITVDELLAEHEQLEVKDAAYWEQRCHQQEAEIAKLKEQLASNLIPSSDDKLKEALKLIVDVVADLVEARKKA